MPKKVAGRRYDAETIADLKLDWIDVCESADHYLVLHSSPEVGRGNRKVQVLSIADRERGDADEVAAVIKRSAAA